MSSEYARSAAKVAAAQLAEAAGFEAVDRSSLEVLAELLLRYINEIGTASHAYAESAGRTDSNALDVTMALTDLGVSLDELREYAKLQEDIPFAQTIAAFPVKKKASAVPTFASKQEEPPRHVPAFLPAFPDKHTYVATPAYPANTGDAAQRAAAAAEAQVAAEQALAKLREREDPQNKLAQLLVGAREGKKEGGAGGGDAAAAGEGGNPFLMRPTWEGQGGEAAAPAPASAGAATDLATAADGQEGPWDQAGAAEESGPAGAKPQLFAPWDLKSQLQRKVQLAASGRPQDGYDDLGAGRGGRRGQKRAAGAVDDATRSKVDEILAGGGEDEGAGLEDGGAAAPIREQI